MDSVGNLTNNLSIDRTSYARVAAGAKAGEEIQTAESSKAESPEVVSDISASAAGGASATSSIRDAGEAAELVARSAENIKAASEDSLQAQANQSPKDVINLLR